MTAGMGYGYRVDGAIPIQEDDDEDDYEEEWEREEKKEKITFAVLGVIIVVLVAAIVFGVVKLVGAGSWRYEKSAAAERADERRYAEESGQR